ncbi:MAG: Ig-like domain-containing protein [Bacteroidales bacterium]|jgi:hypothetical protein|nr:Ig-like domain-containing protein [Bacteroidales bacterium]
MRILYAAVLLLISCDVLAQSNPVAVDDSVQVLNQNLIAIPVLDNDYDPDNDTIVVSIAYSANHGEESYDDTLVYYKSEWYEGWDEIKYKIKKKNNPIFVSEKANIHVEVLENPDVPISVNDTFTITRLQPINLEILSNDLDQNGDGIKINELWYNEGHLQIDYSTDSSFITLTANHSPDDESSFRYNNIERNTQDTYYSNKSRVQLNIEENPDLPIAINDTFQVTAGIPFSAEVLLNDINPIGNSLEIYDYTYPTYGTLSLSNNEFTVVIDTSFEGSTFFNYRIRYEDQTWMYSDWGTVVFQVAKNPDCPVAVSDYSTGLAYSPINLSVLDNDYDPNGDPIEIMEVNTFSQFSSASIDGNEIIYTSNAFTIGIDSLEYRIRQSNDPNYFSGWTNIYLDIEPNPELPIAMPDSGSTKSGIPIVLDVLQNDIMTDTGSFSLSISYSGTNLGRPSISNNMIVYKPFMRSVGVDSFSYYLHRDTLPIFFAKGNVYVDIKNNYCYDSLTINNVNAGFHSSGVQFCAIDEIFGEFIGDYQPHYEIPRGSGKHTIFTHNLWLGGLDDNDSLHLAGERYKMYGNDYQPGPISSIYDSLYHDHWYSLWMVYKSDIYHHIHNWWKEGYNPVRGIADWPGNGNPANGQAEQLAPYYDRDQNGYYDPMQGDYPLIRGDQCIYVIYNDDLEHTETNGDRLGLEIHAMAYGFDEPEDSILNNTVFVHYDLINRSENSYHDFYFGVFADLDLGYAWDDYLGSYIKGSSFYVYNGDDDDEGSQSITGYGLKPPAQSVTILAGPYIDPDQEDNPDGNCDFGVTGTNFGNGIIDDERFGLTRFTYYTNSGGLQGDPSIAPEYYSYLNGFWKDGTPVVFGGNGYHPNWQEWSQCRFMFPGDSDPLNWGTDCELPIGGYNQNGLWWTEEQTGNHPYDRRGFGVSGPFTFFPGQVQEVEMAYIYANSYYNADSSRKLLLSYIDTLRNRVANGEIIIPNNELNINEKQATRNVIQIYPNPARETIYVKGAEELEEAEYRIYNIMGTVIQSGKISAEINIAGLQKGFYIISIITKDGRSSGKFIKQ